MKQFISFEGIDGCGKTTQIDLLSEYLNKHVILHKILREPGGTFLSEKIRQILLDKNNNIYPETETLLFLSARSIIVNEVLVPELSGDKIILFDRYIDST